MDPGILRITKRKLLIDSKPEKKLKHEFLSIAKKIEIIDRYKKGESKTNLAILYGKAKSTIGDIIKNEQNLREFAKQTETENFLEVRKTVRNANDPNLDKALYIWFCQERHLGTPITGDLMNIKARSLNRLLNPTDKKEFIPSDGFIANFIKRHSIKSLSIQGESLSANLSSVENFLEKVQLMIRTEGYSNEQLYNYDETGLYWKGFPKKTFVASYEDKAKGFKISKEKVTILLCANAAGTHRCTPLLIRKSKNPRCLKKIISPPVIYRGNKSSWMTREIFSS